MKKKPAKSRNPPKKRPVEEAPNRFTDPMGFVKVEDLPPLSDEDYRLYEQLGLLYSDEKRAPKK